ncbi:trypsin-like peptidase domain-containing protein [Tundrisphaera sp. TA3]|uniref:trypsin-like peptidase domain-containing protein n=1 Tax=Tundrisphaera sp. TA3 TaxID=3435775 RepID=UPI003EC0F513
MPSIQCPSCNAKGSVPDSFPGGWVKCPKCKQRFEVAGQAKASPPIPKPAAEGPPPSIFDTDLGDINFDQPEPREVYQAGAVLVVAGESKSSPILYGAIALGGLASVLLIVVVVLLLKGGGPAVKPPEPEIVAVPRPEPVAAKPAPVAVAPPKVAAKAADAFPDAPKAVAPDPSSIIERLKEATAFIKLRADGRVISTGSGFVVDVQGDTALIATNRHVALPDGPSRPGAPAQVEVVFRSGQGARNEQALIAEVVGADLSAELDRDLAFLSVRVPGRPPRPLDVGPGPEPTEGMRYTAAGFPLGSIVNETIGNQGNPSITITRGSVSAMRRDEHGQLGMIQLDGSLQPGNSGGPIVDEATGGLIGVAVAKSAMADTIGFVIPARRLREALDGRVGALAIEYVAGSGGMAELDVKAQTVDPKHRLRGVMAVAVAADNLGSFGPNPDGTWPPLPDASPIDLTLSPRASEATGRLRVAVGDRRRVLVQTAHRDDRGTIAYDQPRPIDLPARPGTVADGGRPDDRLRDLRLGSLERLGTLIDPDKECRLAVDRAGFKVEIAVPGKKVYSLSPDFRNRANRPLHNAPMTLAEVDGDFAAMVRVGGDLNPGSELIKGPNGKTMPMAFRGAGLVLYQDKDNFLRLERCGGTVNGAVLVHRLLVEFIRNGRHAMPPIYLDLPEVELNLVMLRRKGRLQCLFGPALNDLVAFREFAIDFPAKVKVGLSASNISKGPFDVTFEDFVVVDDAKTLDQAFGR